MSRTRWHVIVALAERSDRKFLKTRFVDASLTGLKTLVTGRQINNLSEGQSAPDRHAKDHIPGELRYPMATSEQAPLFVPSVETAKTAGSREDTALQRRGSTPRHQLHILTIGPMHAATQTAFA